MDGACAALGEPTAEMRVAEPELVAQYVKQRRIRAHLDDPPLPVSSKAMRCAISNPFSISGCRQSVG